MKVAKLNDFVMCSSNVAGSSYDEWASGTTYATNNNVVVPRLSGGTSEYMPYEEYISTADSNTGNYPPDNLDKWSLLGASNRWKACDGYVNTQTVASAHDWKCIVDASKANLVALFGMYGTELSLTTLGSNLTTDPRCESDSFTSITFVYDNTNKWYKKANATIGENLYQIISLAQGHTYRVAFKAWADEDANMKVSLKGTWSSAIAIDTDKKSYEVDIVAGSDVSTIGIQYDSGGTNPDIYLDDIYVFDTIGTPHTVDLVDATMSDAWTQFFVDNSYCEDYSYSFTFANEQHIGIKITQKSSAAKCGMVAIGSAVELGNTDYDLHIGIDDYSKKATDSLGRTYLSQGSWSKLMTIDIWLDNEDVDLVRRAFTEIRGVTCVADANNSTTTFESLLVCGFWQVFDIIIPGPTISKCSLEFKGLI